MSTAAIPHRRYRDADAALARYVDLCATIGTLRAQDITMGARVDPARECGSPNCRRAENRASAYRVTVNGVDRCRRCNAEWRFVEVGSLGLSIRSSAEGIARRMHGRLAERALLGTILHRRPAQTSLRRWHAMHAAWMLSIYGRHDTDWAASAMRLVTRAALGTSPRSLAELAREAREEIEARLATRGLLERG